MPPFPRLLAALAVAGASVGARSASFLAPERLDATLLLQAASEPTDALEGLLLLLLEQFTPTLAANGLGAPAALAGSGLPNIAAHLGVCAVCVLEL